jgi:hypothetical protein
MVGGVTSTVDAKTFKATALTAGTEYEWKVRAVDGDAFSDWAEGEKFSTKKAGESTDTIVFAYGYFLMYGGDDDLKNWYLCLRDEAAITTGDGVELAMDLYAPGTDSVISDGTYTLGTTVAPWSIFAQYSGGFPVVNGERVTQGSDMITGGSITVSCVDVEYTVVIDLMTYSGFAIKSTFTGLLTSVIGEAPMPGPANPTFFKASAL